MGKWGEQESRVGLGRGREEGGGTQRESTPQEREHDARVAATIEKHENRVDNRAELRPKSRTASRFEDGGAWRSRFPDFDAHCSLPGGKKFLNILFDRVRLGEAGVTLSRLTLVVTEELGEAGKTR